MCINKLLTYHCSELTETAKFCDNKMELKRISGLFSQEKPKNGRGEK
jgi:hypothetical protein